MDYSKLSKEELIALLEDRDAELYQTRKERDEALKKLEEVIEKKNVSRAKMFARKSEIRKNTFNEAEETKEKEENSSSKKGRKVGSKNFDYAYLESHVDEIITLEPEKVDGSAKYIGEDDCFCIELLAYKLVPKGSYLKNGQVIEVPDDLDRVGWFCENTNFDRWEYKTYPVKQKKPNELGLYDMCGNVLEWCSDDYGKYNGSFQINPNPIFNDTGLHSSMARGGCFEFVEKACRVSSRFNTNQTIRSSWFGLRLALSVEK